MEQMLEQARNTLQMEADAILELVPRVDEHFSAAVASDFRLSRTSCHHWYG